ncbi:PAS domain S-box protein, partial [Rhodoferax sp.]|uniref:PAS domain S-box protein n=1 Tax=Rhodoferax sp. TaxID=50421 RepID=UPI002726E5ED
MLVIFLVGLWSLSYYATQMLHKDMERLLGEQQFSTASHVAAEINRELDDRLEALKTIAETGGPAMLLNGATMQTLLRERPLLHGLFNGGVVAHRLDGTAIAEVPLSAGRVGVNDMDIDTVAAALKEGKSTVGRPVMGKKLLAPVFYMTVPMRDAQGSVIGALSGVTNLSQPSFLESLTENRYGKSGGYLLIAPQHRQIITATDRNRSMEMYPAAGSIALLDRIIDGYEGSGVAVNPHGTEVLVSAKGIPAADWVLSATLPTAEAFAPIRAMQQRMLLAAILLTLLAGGFTWWILRRQLSPMLAAVETLAKLSAADQPMKTLPITRQDEIGQMIGGFNRLLETLEQRKQALQESEYRWKFAIEGAGDGLWDLDVPSNTAYFSTSWKQMLGFAEDEIGNGPHEWIDRIHPDDKAKTLGILQGYLDGEISDFVSEHRLRCKDGSYRWIHDRGTVASRCADGKPLRLIGTHRDITARKLADDLLHEQRTQIKLAAQVFAQGREGIMISEAQGTIVMVNKAFTTMSGYSEAELLGKNTLVLSSGLHSPAFYQAMWEGIKRHDRWSGEISDRRKDGTELPAWLAISTMR